MIFVEITRQIKQTIRDLLGNHVVTQISTKTCSYCNWLTQLKNTRVFQLKNCQKNYSTANQISKGKENMGKGMVYAFSAKDGEFEKLYILGHPSMFTLRCFIVRDRNS